jgi:periplasmic protein TonB
MAEQAFGSFAHYGESADKGSWLSSLAASSFIYVLIGLAVLSIPVTQHVIEKRKPVQVKFVERLVKPPPPVDLPKLKVPEAKPLTAPPSQVITRPTAPAAAAPVVRPDQKTRRVDKPPPPKKMEVPKEIPKPAEEVDKELDKGIAVWGDGATGDVAGLEGGMAGGVAGGRVGGGMAVPEDADPPVPSSSNRKPEYPATALAAKESGTVVLKVIIMADGSVGDVKPMRGDEPFLSAAIEAVKRWKFEPARHKGQPITVYQIITIPFRMTG